MEIESEKRERAKLSQEQMAELVNVGRTTISVWEYCAPLSVGGRLYEVVMGRDPSDDKEPLFWLEVEMYACRAICGLEKMSNSSEYFK